MSKYFNKLPENIMEEFNSSRLGLSYKQVENNREKYGENALEEEKKSGIISVFLSQFKDLLVVILIIAAIISLIAGNIESTVVIMLVITLNALLGTTQTIKAEKSLDSLKALSSPTAKIIREDGQSTIDAKEIVMGDIVKIEAGDIVPSDGRLIDCFSLKVNESSLTGESEAVEKNTDNIDTEDVALGDQKNMVFSGSLVTYGRGLYITTAIGTSTEMGKIADLLSNTKERKTPLQVSMDTFSKKLSIVIMIICGVVLGLSLYRGETLIDALLFAVALAVAAIPEALASIITISLAIGTSRMAKENAIIKKLQAVEGLGCVSIICSDKTGTLTQNKMTVEDLYYQYGDYEMLLKTAALCNDTALVDGKTFGDPTETALVDFYQMEKTDYPNLIHSHPRIAELPFDSDRKLMSTLHDFKDKMVMLTKGAPDVLIARSKYYLKNGELIPLTDDIKKEIIEKNHNFSENGLRVLAFSLKNLSTNINETISLDFSMENELVFLGLLAMVDPPRKESALAVKDCISAGIKPIMITGDHKVTATAIAKKIGIFKDGDMAITGQELDNMSQEDLEKNITNISVYARVSPSNKIRIVDTWQGLGNIVAMTGDGVNDAPALKQADIGIAMGITGTQVSKDAASMILLDDNFATIIKSVLNGRNIYGNIKNSIKFLLSGNAAGILAVLWASLAGLAAPFAAVHLLFINLVTDSLPALAISMEPATKGLLKEKPRKSSESILTKDFLISLSLQGLLIAIATMAAFYIGLEKNQYTAMTMAFSTLCLARLWHGFNTRGTGSIFKLGFLTNPYTIGAFVLGFLLLSCILLMPILSKAFMVAPLSLNLWIIMLLLAFAPTLVIQVYKLIFLDKKC